jgi:diguanylate cyclase (GGDEF)-like protein/PAS domain S-box-containing protein
MMKAVSAAFRPDDVAGDAGMLGNLLANLDGLVYRCRIDSNWTMEFLSDGCRALTGYPAGDLLYNGSLSFADIIYPEDRQRIRDIVEAAQYNNQRFSVEYRIVRRDGAIRWVWERGGPVRHRGQADAALEGFIQDITQRKEAEQALHEAERRFRSLFENAVEGIYQSTPDNGYLVVNPALARMHGFDSPEQMIAEVSSIARQIYVHPQRRDEFLRLMAKQGGVANFESQVYHRNGNILWISESARTVRGPADEILFYEGMVIDITERKRYEAQIKHQATHDALTGLPNRNLLYDRLQRAIGNARRKNDVAAVAFIDLDQFKFINDSLGHQIGDEVLKTVGDRLQSCLRWNDTVARQGGDEFVFVLADQKDAESVSDTMRRILALVARPMTVTGLELQVTCSAGISLYPNDALDAETLLRHADTAMYKAKELGRNNFQYFAAEMNVHANERLAMLNSLRHALGNNEFELHYQPKIQLATGKVVGAEALIRWHSATSGTVSPASFIPLAEESGLIIAIGEWVLRTACAQNAAWQRAGYPPIPVSVNLSPRHLARGDLVDLIAEVLRTTGLEARYLELEITENIFMRDVDKSLAILVELKNLGVRISIDDFGTGYSSLNYLKRFPVDILKIDRSFVRDIATGQDDAAIVKAIISLAHILNMKVVAEGVETEEQRRFLLDNACDEVQGYYFGRPVPHGEFAKVLTSGQSGMALL